MPSVILKLIGFTIVLTGSLGMFTSKTPISWSTKELFTPDDPAVEIG